MASTLIRDPIADTGRQRLALAIADVGWFTTDHLFGEVPEARASTLLLQCGDVRVAWARGQRPWNWNRPTAETSTGQWRRDLVLPTGWMKKYPRVGMRPVARTIRRWRAEHCDSSPLALVMTYPYYLYLAEQLRPERLVYYNFDDYRFFCRRSPMKSSPWSAGRSSRRT